MGQLWPGEQLDNLRREVRSDLGTSNSSLFYHFHLLAQLVANALQAFPHRRFVHPGVLREPGRAPVPVVPPVAQPALLTGQGQQRPRESLPLQVRPPRLRLIEHR
jgi:hypothetical protein